MSVSVRIVVDTGNERAEFDSAPLYLLASDDAAVVAGRTLARVHADAQRWLEARKEPTT